MIRTAVVIPYFQRTPGVLRRALDSIYRQDVEADVEVDVIVVDDQSPSPPEPEAAGLTRPGFGIRILKRENGGPGRARNTGLQAVNGADFVAFLDSDDTWREDHLSTALRRLRAGAQFYFSNSLYGDGLAWFSTFRRRDELIAAATREDDGAYSISRERLMPFLLQDCLPHTSTVVLDERSRGGLQFDETQSMAGEDYLFWATFADRCERIAFSADTTAARGRGVDIYRGRESWDNPDWVRCAFHNLTLRRKFLSRLARNEEDRRTQLSELAKLRKEIAYLFVRNAFAHAPQNWWVTSRIWREDPLFWLYFPANVAISFGERIAARLGAQPRSR